MKNPFLCCGLLCCTLLSLVPVSAEISTDSSGTAPKISPNPFAKTPPYAKTPSFIPLPLGEVKPSGWLLDWCRSAAEGIVGHSDDLDPLFAKGWLDADAQGSLTGAQVNDNKAGYVLEQAGYWIDGATRLAHLLGDEALLTKCRKRFEAILKRVDANEAPMNVNVKVWNTGGKWAHWPMAVMGRALLAEYTATNDPRYLDAIARIYHDYAKYDAAPDPKDRHFSLIHHQGRQLMNVEIMLEAYRLGGPVSLRDDAIAVLRAQSREISNRLQWHEKGIAEGRMDDHFYSVPFGHAVTLNESAKIPAIGYQYTGEGDWLRFSELSYQDMEKNEMEPYGLTSAHEHLEGVGPFSTTEMCNAVDYAWSNIWLLRITGNPVYGDRVERDFFNAGPGGIAPDFKTHVYFLSPNRIDPSHPGKPVVGGFPSYAAKQFPLCCTGNISRLLPNYIMHLWMASKDGGLAATLYGPSEVRTAVAGTGVKLSTRTSYPLGDDISISVDPEHPASFPLHLRVPSWCGNPGLAVNGEKQSFKVEGGFIRLEREWKPGDVVRLSLPMEARVGSGICADKAPYSCVRYGPLLFALPIPTQGNDLNKPKPGTHFQFALQPGSATTVSREPLVSPWSWSNVPVKITLKAMPAVFGKNFELPKDVVPIDQAKLSDITLVPFGCTAFRVSMFGVAQPK